MSSKSSGSRAGTGNGGSTDIRKKPTQALEAVCGAVVVTSAVAVAVMAGAVVLERTDKAPALALGAGHGWCRSGERLPGGSAGGGEGGTSTSHGGRCMEGVGVKGSV